MTPKAQIIFSLTAPTLLAGAAFAQPVGKGGTKFMTTMTGANECNSSGTCNLGDPDGTGTAAICVSLRSRRSVVPGLGGKRTFGRNSLVGPPIRTVGRGESANPGEQNYLAIYRARADNSFHSLPNPIAVEA